MKFDMQWGFVIGMGFVIGIPRDLFFNTAIKVKPFSFFHLLQ